MPTDIPIRVAFPRSVWRVAETTEYEIAEALKHMLLLAVVNKDVRADFEYILNELADFAKSICETTEIQWFCLVGARLEQLYGELVEKGG